MNRHDALAIGGTSALVAGFAVALKAGQDTPVMALFREWSRLHVVQADLALPEKESESAFDAMIVVEDKLLAEPAQSAADVLAKFVAYTSFGSFSFPDEFSGEQPQFWTEARAVLGA